MTSFIVILICLILLIAYVFDLTSSKTRIPSVILLLVLGWILRQGVATFYDIIPDLKALLPAFGTIGLILIVLEGTMDLEISKEEIPLIKKSFVISLVSLLTLFGLLTYTFNQTLGIEMRSAMVNAIPFCIVSSSIAISSVRNWNKSLKSLVTYESTLSDILGVMIFNFLILNTVFNFSSFIWFGLELIIIAAVSAIASFLLSYLMSNSRHHIKYGPILIMVILTYYLTKIFHLPGLVFIAIFGLFLGNYNNLGSFNPFTSIKTDSFSNEINSFKEIVKEATFLVRSLFFILFGYTIEMADLLNSTSIKLALIIVFAILILRFLLLKILKLNRSPILFVFPRGLITILLFYNIPENLKMKEVNNSLVLQVILLTLTLMLFGEFFKKSKTKNEIDSIIE